MIAAILSLAVFLSVLLLTLALWPERGTSWKDLFAEARGRGRRGILLIVSPLVMRLAPLNGDILRRFLGRYGNLLRRKIMMAGRGGNLSPEEFLGAQELAAVAAGIAGLSLLSPLLLPLPLLLGFFLPLISLNGAVSRRHARITKSLPYHLDLLTVTVEAGLDFMGALSRVVEKGHEGPLRDEFLLTLQQIRLGRTRAEALRETAERNRHPDLSLLVASLVQSDRLGTGLGESLRIQAEQMRVRRSQRAEKKAFEAPVKMLFPLIAFIFPTVFIILFVPIVLKLMEVF